MDLPTQAIAELIRGTPTQQRAAEFVVWHETQDSISKCMSEAGFDYVTPPFVDPSILRSPEAVLGSAYFEPLFAGNPIAANRIRARQIPSAPTGQRQYNSLTDAQRAAFDARLDKCASVQLTSDNGLPAVVPAVYASLDPILAAAEKDLSVQIADYQACMKDAGWPVRNFDELWDSVAALYNTSPPGTPTWRAAEQRESDAWAADTACRSPLLTDAVGVLTPAMESWRSEQADLLANLDAQWTQVVKRAQSYPDWPPSTG